MTPIRIGNGAGFWGDNLDAPRRLCEAGQLDFLTLEYLAELTMSILAHHRQRDPSAGWVTDFETVARDLIPCLAAQPNLKIVTNAGGLNPAGCATAIARVLDDAGLDAMIAAVGGDDLHPRIDELRAAGEPFSNSETGGLIDTIADRIVSANAYLGAAGIVRALGAGARIVITGRVADSSLTVGPAIHSFGWSWNDWPRLAAATVAGHLIECGAQCTGGMYSAWMPGIPLADVGYPIAVLSADGGLEITKPPGSGGIVNIETVAEQLVYEIGDPRHYLTPDIDVDFSNVRLSQVGPNRVRVEGAAGQPPPDTFKVSLAYRDGFIATGTLVLCGPRAVEFARASGRMILDRVRAAGVELERTKVEVIGSGDIVGGIIGSDASPWDVTLRVSAWSATKQPLERFAREFAPLVTAGPPGVTGYTGGRAQPRPVLAYWPTKISRSRVEPAVDVRTVEEWLQ